MSSGPARWLVTLEFHDDTFSRDAVVINIDNIPECDLPPGSLARVAPYHSAKTGRSGRHPSDQHSNSDGRSSATPSRSDTESSDSRASQDRSKKSSRDFNVEDTTGIIERNRSLVYRISQPSPEQVTKKPLMQISLHSDVKAAFGFANRQQAVVYVANAETSKASFVELSFRDQYLSRADMWQLVVAELTGKPVYKGQQVVFMGAIKAKVRNIFFRGRRVNASMFTPSTVPIYRSESAKYIFFIQMSREMWEYDVEGSGEIIFNKVVNGFLPDLFKRWQKTAARHLVSIVLFSRIEYEKGILKHDEFEQTTRRGKSFQDQQKEYRDYYRVVTTNLVSSEWTRILHDLKREFKIFLRDILILPGNQAYGRIPDTLADVKESANVDRVIAGRPSIAAHGNILESINLAASQFANDHVDRDLTRTNLSVVIITGGTGVFEVDYNMLKLTTDTLVGNGIGIDLVSLSPMPLHSVPLFRYRTPKSKHQSSTPLMLGALDLGGSSTPRNINFLQHLSQSPFKSRGQQVDITGATYLEDGYIAEPEWSYALPHWIDVSFWTGVTSESSSWVGTDIISETTARNDTDLFLSSCRMYELQMMGLMEVEMADISIAQLYFDQDALDSYCDLAAEIAEQKAEQARRKHEEENRQRAYKGLPPLILDSIHTKDRERDESEAILDLWMQNHDKEVFDEIDLSKHEPRLPSGVVLSKENGSGNKVLSKTGLPRQLQDPGGISSTASSPGSGPPFLSSHQRKESTSSIAASDAASVQSPRGGKPVRTTHPRPQASRQFSLGLRGLGPGKASATTSIVSATVGVDNRPYTEPTEARPQKNTGLLTEQLRRTLRKRPSELGFADDDSSETDEYRSKEPHSHPIQIRNDHVDGSHQDDDVRDATVRPDGVLSDKMNGYSSTVKVAKMHARGQSPRVSQNGQSASLKPHHLSPVLTKSPWLTMLNPSNPRRDNISLASQYRRWHHVFPRAVPTSVIKWKSLISPASLPLTSEFFPTYEQLYDDYTEYSHHVANADPDVSTIPPLDGRSLLRQLIASRIANGFQIVVGGDAETYAGILGLRLLDCLEPELQAGPGHVVLLSTGDDFHQLQCLGDDTILVRRFVKRTSAHNEEPKLPPSVRYQAHIRTMLDETYMKRRFELTNRRTKLEWTQIDEHSAGLRGELSPDFRYWRARFVLLPVDIPKNARSTLASVAEVSDEETRLEGIQKLTQMWQRQRFLPPHEKRFQPSIQQQHKDTNLLAIDYHTRDPSAVIRAHATAPTDSWIDRDPHLALFAEADLYHSNDFDTQKLAQDLQAKPPRGLTVADRRWHWRLYQRCFRGDELTTWLLANFKDMESREDAVRFGNELMKKGLFTHVQSKHLFKDGNYFYQIAAEYRASSHAENRAGWFSRMTDRSVPPTPGPEVKNSPISDRPPSRSSRDDSGSSSGQHTPLRDRTIELSKMLIFDVDPKGKSWRPELIHLHYDRIHNPENCYHIRIDWMNVTSKLIEDVIASWATTVERYGLRLVEIPISEACSISTQHPFRAPFKIELALQPPKTPPRTYFDTSSLSVQPMDDHQPFHKALLRKWDFVLDMESARSFGSTVPVTYSWGKPDYKYHQFIHKSGTLIVQITDEGNFLLLANRLYSNRAPSTKDTSKQENNDRQAYDRTRTASASAITTPSGSPLIRAADVPPSPLTRPGHPGRLHTAASKAATGGLSLWSNTAAQSFSESRLNGKALAAETVGLALKAFCLSRVELELFYDEVALLPHSASPSPRLGPFEPSRVGSPRATPILRGVGAGLGRFAAAVGSVEGRGQHDDIPVLGLGERRLGLGGLGAPAAAGAGRVGSYVSTHAAGAEEQVHFDPEGLGSFKPASPKDFMEQRP